MYCKNCGRQLKEGTRFCDRCGQSVRKSSQSSQDAKRREIEELKAERLNRKKRLQEKEARQELSRKRKKNTGCVFAFVIIILIVAVASVMIGYIMSGGSNSEISSTSAPSESAVSTTSPITSPDTSASTSKNGYSTITVGNVECPYPSTFNSNTVSGNEKLNLTDALGGASMIVTQEGKSGEPKDLMLDYASSQGGDVLYSRAGDDWYAITIESDEKINHRKCIVRNGIAVCYDFSYNSDSASSDKYEEYIEYIDANFK
ncbi:MAG: zinc-ribbon domain-containing protein [Oscillospiraceae bacterium]|nr:zinc-ribbon domain-containing protein [Oscillospiraceae bacterium]